MKKVVNIPIEILSGLANVMTFNGTSPNNVTEVNLPIVYHIYYFSKCLIKKNFQKV